MGKKAKYKVALDRISMLPDRILSHILSFLQGIDAVRSSVLSHRWRYLFKSMSTLDFDHYLPCVREKDINEFKSFIDTFFFNPNGVSLECFRVNDSWVNNNLSWDDDYSRIYGWIHAALWRGVKEIDITLNNDDTEDNDDEERDVPKLPKLPTLLFTCQSLVTMKLDIKDFMDVPTKLCLPNLKTLNLTHIEFDSVSFRRLITSLHALEDLVITACNFDDTSELNIHNVSLKRLVLDFNGRTDSGTGDYDYVIVINAPSLVYFQYIDMVGKGYTLSNMNSLEKADIRIKQLEDVDRERSVTNLLQGICNVQSLYLTSDGFETLPRRLLDEQLAFHYLVELKFQNNYDDWKGTWLLEFLHCVPNLKKLILDLASAKKGFRVLPKEVPSCLSFHLKEITISNFKGDAHIFELISYFLNNAIVLEKLVLGINTLREKRQLGILKKVRSLPKNSKKCQVVSF